MKVLDAARKVLREEGPMHYRKLAKRIIDRKLRKTEGKTFDRTVNALICVELQSEENSDFVRLSPGTYGLRDLSQSKGSGEEGKNGQTEIGQGTKRTLAPWLPLYSEVRLLLEILSEVPSDRITGLLSTIEQYRGTRKDRVSWDNPDKWIEERLEGESRKLAKRIWKRSKEKINPSQMRGHWWLIQRYNLFEIDAGKPLKLTMQGSNFKDDCYGETVRKIDLDQGIPKVLSLVTNGGPISLKNMLAPWEQWLRQISLIRSSNMIRDTLRLRLNNLIDRQLVKREHGKYSLASSNKESHQIENAQNLKQGVMKSTAIQNNIEQDAVKKVVVQNNNGVREVLKGTLQEIDPEKFEHIVKLLLEVMGYQNVKVTEKSGDGGIDVVGEIEIGITSVREAVQVKRHKRTIQRKEVDALRGSLNRANAVRGTIIATSDFSSGAKDAATERGNSPITLINGDKLVELMIDYDVGIGKEHIEVLSFDESVFVGLES